MPDTNLIKPSDLAQEMRAHMGLFTEKTFDWDAFPASRGFPDLTRAQQTAAPLARLAGLPVVLDKDLRERSGGDWEGLADAEIRERYPAERATWNPPNGEPTSVVADRVAGVDGQLTVESPSGGPTIIAAVLPCG